MPNFRLVNPALDGTIQTVFSSSSPTNAAKQAWTTLSKYMENSTPQFAFTLQNMSGGQLHHYLIKESVKGKEVDFTIDQLNINLSPKQSDAIIKQAEKIYSQSGGKEKSSSSSTDDSSESDDSLYEKVKLYKKKHASSPINYWWYYPYYFSLDTSVKSVFMPTFNFPYLPLFEISASSAFFG